MSLYLLLVFVHVCAAVAVIGISGVAVPVLLVRLRRAESTASVRALAHLAAALARVERTAGIVTLLAGAALTVLGRWWGDAWLLVALVVFFSSAGIASKAVEPALARVIDAAEGDGPISEALDGARWAAPLVRGDAHAVANDVLIVFLMTNKPGLALALAAAATAHLVAGAAGTLLLRGRRAGQPRPAVRA